MNRGRRAADVEIDLGIQFVKSRETASPKVFKVRALRLAAGARIALRKRISLAQQTTRTHRPGRHTVDIRINGQLIPAGAFHLSR